MSGSCQLALLGFISDLQLKSVLPAEDSAELGHTETKFVSLLIPEQHASDGDESAAIGEGRYMWAREFTPVAQDQSDTGKPYVLSLSDEGAMWIPIEFNVQLSKRKRDDLSHLTVPAHVRAPSDLCSSYIVYCVTTWI